MKLPITLSAQLLMLVLAVSCALLACRNEEQASAPFGAGIVGSAQAPPERLPAATPEALDSPCRIAHIEWRDRSTPVLPAGTLTTSLLGELLGDLMESGEPGWTLFLELAVTRSAKDPGELQYGVRGFLKDLNQVPPPVLEALAAGEAGPIVDCDDWSGQACQRGLREKVLVPPLQLVLRELSFLCEVRQMDGETLVAALAQADPWQQVELVRAAGELGDGAVAPAIRALLATDHEKVKLGAIGALGRLRDEAALPQLVRMTQGAPETTVRAVMVALADIGSAEARRYLETWARHHPLSAMRELAGELLKAE